MHRAYTVWFRSLFGEWCDAHVCLPLAGAQSIAEMLQSHGHDTYLIEV